MNARPDLISVFYIVNSLVLCAHIYIDCITGIYLLRFDIFKFCKSEIMTNETVQRSYGSLAPLRVQNDQFSEENGFILRDTEKEV